MESHSHLAVADPQTWVEDSVHASAIPSLKLATVQQVEVALVLRPLHQLGNAGDERLGLEGNVGCLRALLVRKGTSGI